MFLLFKDWVIPTNVLDKSDIVRILLRFIRDEAGLPDYKRPFTTTLAASWGKESDAIQTIIRDVRSYSRRLSHQLNVIITGNQAVPQH